MDAHDAAVLAKFYAVLAAVVAVYLIMRTPDEPK